MTAPGRFSGETRETEDIVNGTPAKLSETLEIGCWDVGAGYGEAGPPRWF